MLVFIALAASALLAAVAFGIAGRTTQFNYSVNEAELQYENIYEVIQDTADELTLDEIYRYILYPAAARTANTLLPIPKEESSIRRAFTTVQTRMSRLPLILSQRILLMRKPGPIILLSCSSTSTLIRRCL